MSNALLSKLWRTTKLVRQEHIVEKIELSPLHLNMAKPYIKSNPDITVIAEGPDYIKIEDLYGPITYTSIGWMYDEALKIYYKKINQPDGSVLVITDFYFVISKYDKLINKP